MIRIAVLHPTLPQLLRQSAGTRAAGIEVARCAADVEEFRAGLASQRIDALVLGLAALGSQPVREIDRLRKYTRARATIVTHGFTDTALLREVRERVDLVIVREPLTPTRLRALLGRVLDLPELATEPDTPRRQRRHEETTGDLFDELMQRTPVPRQYDDVQLGRIFEEAVAGDYEYTQHVAELLIHLAGFEEYCQRRNAGRGRARGLHTDVEHGVAHARAIFEQALARLTAATGLQADESDDIAASPGAKVHDIRAHKRSDDIAGSN